MKFIALALSISFALLIFNAGSAVAGNNVADLSITKIDSADPVPLGFNFDYILSVSNAGPSAASNLIVTDSLPVGVSYVAASGLGWGCNEAAAVVTCTRAALMVGPAPDITVTVTATAVGVVNNIASASADEPDPGPGNNSDNEDTTILAAAVPASIPAVQAWGLVILVLLMLRLGIRQRLAKS